MKMSTMAAGGSAVGVPHPAGHTHHQRTIHDRGEDTVSYYFRFFLKSL